MKNRPLYYKSLSDFEFDGITVSGYLASFGNKDSDGDVIVKGAFTKSLNERGVNSTTARKIAYLYQHDMTKPIGKFTTLVEDDKGLYFEAQLDDIDLAEDVAIQYKSGTLNQHSIGFRYIYDKTKHDSESDTYYLYEVDLFEGSVVTMGASENTPFMGFKSEQIVSELDKVRKETERVLKNMPFEEQYKLRQLISKHISLIEVEPIKDTLKIEPIEPKVDWAYISKHLKTI